MGLFNAFTYTGDIVVFSTCSETNAGFAESAKGLKDAYLARVAQSHNANVSQRVYEAPVISATPAPEFTGVTNTAPNKPASPAKPNTRPSGLMASGFLFGEMTLADPEANPNTGYGKPNSGKSVGGIG
ncbi:MAG: hypothetical protein SFT90_00835 [Rickettsiales bacterium]|nr:hypothetical protein [Rickettsiales bacterium]